MLIGLIALLLLSTVVYTVVRDGDAYQYYTGIGDGISISPDDQKIAFSYYRGGEEGIYTANMDGSDVEKVARSEEHTSELQSRFDLVCRLLLEKKKSRNSDATLGKRCGTSERGEVQ